MIPSFCTIREVRHRLFPPPSTPWVQEHVWHDLLFAHWPVSAETVQRLLPQGLSVDLFEGSAWLGVIPFRLSGIRLRNFPPLPFVSAFTELNVRTYVTCNGKAGVYFFSLDADSLFNVAVARAWYRLNYQYARMSLERHGEEVQFRSRRFGWGAMPKFRAAYRPVASPIRSLPGSIEYFLTERYCLYTVDRQNRVLCGEIHHAPWPLQRAEAEIEINTMAAPLGFKLRKTAPLLHFARRMEVLVWRLEPVRP